MSDIRSSPVVKIMMFLSAVAVFLAACSSSEGAELTFPVGSLAAEGQLIAESRGCTSCHSTNGKRKAGPTWKGLAGSEVQLRNGEAVVADADYLIRSITDPGAEVVDSFRPIMPSYDFSRDELNALIAFIGALDS